MILLKTKKEIILKKLQSITSIVERRHSLPILMNVLLSFKENKLRLTTSDIEIEIMSGIEIDKPEHDQKLTVSAKKLLDILNPENILNGSSLQLNYYQQIEIS